MTVDIARPGEPGYEIGRANTIVQEQPFGVVTARSAADVQDAVRYAAAHDLPVAVQATGHAYTAPADGALLISTRAMTGISIDAAHRTARVEAGVQAGALIDAAAEHGLAPITGAARTVGIVGLTLGGGFGPLGRLHGYAADHVRELAVVTADGSLVTASPSQNADLFWATRGGRGNFGVVTAMVVDLVPVTRLYGGGLYFSASSTARVLELYRSWVDTVPDELSSSFALLRLPPLEVIPEPIRGKFVLHVRIAYTGDAESGEALVRPLREAAPALIDDVREMPYTAVASIHNDPEEPGPFVERSALLHSLDALDVLLELAGPDADPPLSLVELRHLGGAIARPPARPSAVGFRDAAFTVFAGTVGLPDLVEPAEEFLDRLVKALSPWRVGGPYVSFLSGPDLSTVETAFEPADYQRLRKIKAVYDPANLFRVNHNIAPDAKS